MLTKTALVHNFEERREEEAENCWQLNLRRRLWLWRYLIHYNFQLLDAASYSFLGVIVITPNFNNKRQETAINHINHILNFDLQLL